MSTALKQSTAHTLRIGPFLDETDGKTAETALTITQPDIRLSKAGGDFAQINAAGTLTHDEAGWYILTLDTTDTNTVGSLIIAIHESGALPVWREFQVVEEAIDAMLFASGATGIPATATPALIADAVVAALQDEVRYGTAQAGAATTITLDAGASAVDDFYNGCAILLLEGTGTPGIAVPARLRVITDYVGSTKVATVAAWDTAPDATTKFVVIGKN